MLMIELQVHSILLYLPFLHRLSRHYREGFLDYHGITVAILCIWEFAGSHYSFTSSSPPVISYRRFLLTSPFLLLWDNIFNILFSDK